MTTNNVIRLYHNEHSKVIDLVIKQYTENIESIARLLGDCLKKNGRLFWCGNGGSASDSQHLSTELLVRFKKNRKALRSVALTADASLITCVANDYNFSDIFSRQIEALAYKDDVLIVFSTSGNSENILKALKVANELGLKTVALLGKNGGLAKNLAHYAIVVPSDNTSRIQEAHIFIGHVFCELIEIQLGFA